MGSNLLSPAEELGRCSDACFLGIPYSADADGLRPGTGAEQKCSTLGSGGGSRRPFPLWCRVPAWEFGPGSLAATPLVTGRGPIPLGRLLPTPPLPRPLPPLPEAVMANHSRSALEQQLPTALQAVNIHAAGIDVGSE